MAREDIPISGLEPISQPLTSDDFFISSQNVTGVWSSIRPPLNEVVDALFQHELEAGVGSLLRFVTIHEEDRALKGDGRNINPLRLEPAGLLNEFVSTYKKMNAGDGIIGGGELNSHISLAMRLVSNFTTDRDDIALSARAGHLLNNLILRGQNLTYNLQELVIKSADVNKTLQFSVTCNQSTIVMMEFKKPGDLVDVGRVIREVTVSYPDGVTDIIEYLNTVGSSSDLASVAGRDTSVVFAVGAGCSFTVTQSVSDALVNQVGYRIIELGEGRSSDGTETTTPSEPEPIIAEPLSTEQINQYGGLDRIPGYAHSSLAYTKGILLLNQDRYICRNYGTGGQFWRAYRAGVLLRDDNSIVVSEAFQLMNSSEYTVAVFSGEEGPAANSFVIGISVPEPIDINKLKVNNPDFKSSVLEPNGMGEDFTESPSLAATLFRTDESPNITQVMVSMEDLQTREVIIDTTINSRYTRMSLPMVAPTPKVFVKFVKISDLRMGVQIFTENCDTLIGGMMKIAVRLDPNVSDDSWGLEDIPFNTLDPIVDFYDYRILETLPISSGGGYLKSARLPGSQSYYIEFSRESSTINDPYLEVRPIIMGAEIFIDKLDLHQ